MNITHNRLAHSAGTLILAAAIAGSLAGTLAGCSGTSAASTPNGSVVIGAAANGAAQPTSISVTQVASIRKELPKSILASGKLTVGIGDLPTGFPPLAFTGSDLKTETGSEPDIARLVAAVLGLKPDIHKATWDNMFVGIDDGKTDVGFANITDTEQRKSKYDFASYRQDNVSFEVLASSKWNFDGNYENLAGQTVAVSSGTNQEKLLLEWQRQLRGEGKTLTIKYYPGNPTTYLALDSGKIDAAFGPNPDHSYHVAQDAKSANPTRIAGKYSGAGATLQGLIAAASKKGSGLNKPVADAINYLIKSGRYAQWLKTWNLGNEAVTKSEINPPGLPLDNQ